MLCSARVWGERPILLAVSLLWCLPGCCHLFVDGLGQEPLIPDLLEVVIVGKRLPYSTVSHHDKRGAVCATEGFVSVPLEHLPGFVFPLWSIPDDRDSATGTNFFPEFDRNVMPCPMQQRGILLIEHSVARHIACPSG